MNVISVSARLRIFSKTFSKNSGSKNSGALPKSPNYSK